MNEDYFIDVKLSFCVVADTRQNAEAVVNEQMKDLNKISGSLMF